ncbi:hypothetical protein [Cellulomonas sp. HZM]|uniref:hypothetical protein n=1 Tax=Cellulomonas sp. HZM TaxID=1454010 RepID=UPI00049342DF|nr:hypothetical protein [Cellulomonas sp. HZM]
MAADVDLVTLEEAKNFLNIPLESTSDDDELAKFITAASKMLARKFGVGVPQLFSDVQQGGREHLVLSHCPVVSVTSVTAAGVALAETDYVLDESAGILTSARGQFGPGPLVVTYTAGYDPVPEDLSLAGNLQVRHLWETQRGTGRRTGGGSTEPPAGAAYTWSYRVLEIMDSFSEGGFA